MKDKIIFLAVVFFFNTSISSNETEVGQCKVIEDPAARLACYDSFFQPQPDEPNIAKKNTSSPNINSLKKNITPPKKAKLTQIATNKISKSINQIKQFGLPKKESEKPIAVQAKITKINKLGSFKLDIYLDNGQVWRTVESIYKVRIKKSQEVYITKAAISGYIMKITDKKIALRVNRVR